MSTAGNNQKLNGNIGNLTLGKNQSPTIISALSSSSSTAQHQQQQQFQQQSQHTSQHQHHLQQPQAIQSHSAAPTVVTAAVHQQISSGNHHHQQQQQHHNNIINNNNHINNNNNNNNNIVSGLQHSIPPRYQPPPVPSGGILKHISGNGGTKSSGYYPGTELGATHLNIKYPPDIPKLATVYIPDSVKNSGNPARFTQRPPPHRLSGSGVSGHISVLGLQNPSHHDEHLIRQQQQQHQQQQQQQQSQQQQQIQQHQQEMLKFVRKPDQDPATTTTVASGGGVVSGSGSGGINANSSTNGGGPTTNNVTGPGRLTVEQNRHLQSLIAELRALKEANQRLSDDNQELRDLCCFLDDDRQKGRKLAREWQRFGRYTASVMRQEVSAYQNKLRQLDDKQQELIRDNLELKELCLYLDEERAHVAANTLCVNCGASTRSALRDDGDGSSSSTNADETISTIRHYDRQIPELNLRSTLSDQTLQYVRSLERRIRQLEEERLAATNGNNTHSTLQQQQQTTTIPTSTSNGQQIPDPISGRPEAVVRALQVLEVREQLERDRIGNPSATPEQMDDGEKALVREMCNVVWRKLEESPNGPNMDPI